MARMSKKPNSILLEATRHLKKYFYKKPTKWRGKTVDDIVKEHPDISIAELIRIFFRNKHTLHDPATQKEFKKSMPKPWVEIDETKKKLTIRLGSFVGAFIGSKYEKKYVDDVQHTLHQPPDGSAAFKSRRVVIDLRYNGGGSEKVMLKALRGIEKWGRGTVLVGPHTASAGEMVAATLIYDYKFKRKGGKTAGMLSHMKNIILKDGSFLGVTTGHYTTPGGHMCKKFHL